MWKMHVLRSDIHCVNYAKIWTVSDLFFPVYNSVLIQRNTDRILSICEKIRIRESSHFGVFFALIRKKKQFLIKFKISQCTFVLSLNKITIFLGGNFCNVIGVKSFIVLFNFESCCRKELRNNSYWRFGNLVINISALALASALAFRYKNCFWHNTNLI